MCGSEYTIADMAIFPWVRCIEVLTPPTHSLTRPYALTHHVIHSHTQTGYNAEKFVQLDSYKHVARWRETIAARPAVKRGLRVNGWGASGLLERHSHADFAEKGSLHRA